MKVLKFPTIAITLGFMLGIVAGNRMKPDPASIFPILLAQLFLLFCLLIWSRKAPKINFFFGIFVYLLSVSCGLFVFASHYQPNHNKHYSNWHKTAEPVVIKGVISEELKPNAYAYRYFLEVQQINQLERKGKLLVSFSKTNTAQPPTVGTVLLVKGIIEALPKPKNPNQFDYAQYLEKSNVFHQIHLKDTNFRHLAIEKKLPYFLQKYRLYIRDNLAKNDIPQTRLALIQALLLGQRQEIDSVSIQNYSKAGAIHILAISGLHIGILLFLFKWLLSPLRRASHGTLQLGSLLLLLWMYALLSGLSPSVVRAVTMFSFVSIGIYLQRATNIFNTLAVSILMILLFKPSFLFEVGFQLSYSAVLAIVVLQPIMKQFWYPKNKIGNYFYQILTVSVAAQIGVLPLSLYYFHQFPGLFFVTNLVLIPLLTVILVVGIFVIITYSLHLSIPFLNWTLSETVGVMNDYVAWIASFEKFVFSEIPFSEFLLVVLYGVLLSLIVVVKKPSYLRLQWLLLALLSFQLVYFGSRLVASQSEEAILFQHSQKTVLTLKHKKEITVFTNDTLATQQYILKNYKQSVFGKIVAVKEVPNVLYLSSKKLLIVDKHSIYKIPEKAEIIVLTDSPKINLERMIEYHRPEIIVADGSNYLNRIAKWKKTCLKKNIPFHATYEKGYFKMNY